MMDRQTANISNLKNFGVIDASGHVPHGLDVNAPAPCPASTIRTEITSYFTRQLIQLIDSKCDTKRIAQPCNVQCARGNKLSAKALVYLTSAGSCASPLPFQCCRARSRCCCIAASKPFMSTSHPACFATRHVKSAGNPNES
jgi:hypothetical protein